VSSETPARRQRRASAERSADVLAAARRLFAEKGFHATGTRELAAAADINDALLYRFFANKDAILAALVDELIAAFGALPQAVADGHAEELSTADLLELIGTAFLTVATEQIDLLTILISEHQALAEDHRFVNFIHLAATGLGARLDSLTGTADGYITARAFMGSLVAFVLLQNVLGLETVQPMDPAIYIHHLATVTARGLQPPAAPPN
jgi:AcrR family transcriptional regulator